MSDRPVDINLSSVPATHVKDETAERLGGMTLEEARKRVAHVYDRARTVDRLHVQLPPGVHGEWVSRDPVAIHAKEMLGFEIDTKYAINRKLNDVGDGTAVVGDVVFMICPQVLKDAMDEEQARRYAETHLKKRQIEERDFENNVKTLKIDSVVESETTHVTGSEITQALTNR